MLWSSCSVRPENAFIFKPSVSPISWNFPDVWMETYSENKNHGQLWEYCTVQGTGTWLWFLIAYFSSLGQQLYFFLAKHMHIWFHSHQEFILSGWMCVKGWQLEFLPVARRPTSTWLHTTKHQLLTSLESSNVEPRLCNNTAENIWAGDLLNGAAWRMLLNFKVETSTCETTDFSWAKECCFFQ